MNFPKISKKTMTTMNYWNSTSKQSNPASEQIIPALKTFIKPTISTSNPNFPPQYFNGTQLLSLYNIVPVLPLSLNTTVSKIAVIVAYTYPNLLKDLTTYWTNNINFGPTSTPPRVNIKTMPGATQNAGWAQEECLDVQLVCTVNPNANIWVIEAKSDTMTDIMAAIDYATTTLRCDVISMSFGISDIASNIPYNRFFIPTTNTCFCAASGDSNTVSWPAVLPNCIAVGGTSLIWTPNAANQRTEYTWNGAGCGYSGTIAQPAYQQNVANILHTRRVIPDISLIANPQTGVYTVYNGSWYMVGGTSVATPIFAGMMSIANQMRFNAGKPPLTTCGTNNIQNYLYNTVLPSATLYKNAFNDITIGTDQGSSSTGVNGLVTYSAEKGWDMATGLGSPNCSNLCTQLSQL